MASTSEMSSSQDLKSKGENLRKRLNHVAHALEDHHKFINGMKFFGSFYAFAGGGNFFMYTES